MYVETEYFLNKKYCLRKSGVDSAIICLNNFKLVFFKNHHRDDFEENNGPKGCFGSK